MANIETIYQTNEEPRRRVAGMAVEAPGRQIRSRDPMVLGLYQELRHRVPHLGLLLDNISQLGKALEFDEVEESILVLVCVSQMDVQMELFLEEFGQQREAGWVRILAGGLGCERKAVSRALGKQSALSHSGLLHTGRCPAVFSERFVLQEELVSQLHEGNFSPIRAIAPMMRRATPCQAESGYLLRRGRAGRNGRAHHGADVVGVRMMT